MASLSITKLDQRSIELGDRTQARYGAQIDRFYADLGEDSELDLNDDDPPF